MLLVAVRDLNRGPVRTDGELPPDHAAFEGLEARLAAPLRLQGVLRATLDGSYVWQARLHGSTVGACRRCLAEVVSAFDAEVDAVYSADPEIESDPSVYPLVEPVQAIALSVAVREEVGLAASTFPLCRE